MRRRRWRSASRMSSGLRSSGPAVRVGATLVSAYSDTRAGSPSSVASAPLSQPQPHCLRVVEQHPCPLEVHPLCQGRLPRAGRVTDNLPRGGRWHVENEMIDVIVVGAGILGLALAREPVQNEKRLRFAVLEKENRIAQRTWVVEGEGLHPRECAPHALLPRAHGIQYERCGKVVVATRRSDLPRIDALYHRGLPTATLVSKSSIQVGLQTSSRTSLVSQCRTFQPLGSLTLRRERVGR